MSDKRPTILAVDDESGIRDILTEYLHSLGYEVLTASGGYEALDILKRTEPDLVLTDVMMRPMDGLELLRRIKAARPEISVVVFTAVSAEDIEIEARRAGAFDFFKKPFTLDRLDRVLRNALRARAHEADYNASDIPDGFDPNDSTKKERG